MSEVPESNQSEHGAPASSAPNAEPAAVDQARISELETQLKEKDGKYLYLYAEFENFKKRVLKERMDLVKYGWENVARDLLSVLDNLERALAHMPADTQKTLADGLKMVCSQFKTTLEKQGIETVKTLGQPFDPNLHEAVAQEASGDSEGVVVGEHAKGYVLHGRLLRPAQVIVSCKKTEGT